MSNKRRIVITAGATILIIMALLGVFMVGNLGGLPRTGLANPASTYCEEQGGKVQIQTRADGGQVGMCVFPNGSTCEEWAFYRKECTP